MLVSGTAHVPRPLLPPRRSSAPRSVRPAVAVMAVSLRRLVSQCVDLAQRAGGYIRAVSQEGTLHLPLGALAQDEAHWL